MDVRIHLENNYSPWKMAEENDTQCWIKGDLFYNDEPLQESAALSLFSSLPFSCNTDSHVLRDLLLRINGSFALVIKTPCRILCVVDRIRSIPLFYAKTDSSLDISDDANNLREQINPLLNEISGAEFLVAGYVTGSATLFDGIYQIRAGEYLDVTGEGGFLTTSVYHRFWHENYYPDTEEELLKRLDIVFTQVFRRLITSIKEHGYQIVVPLSGGLDSRVIVSMLKRCGVDDAICFSYGRKGNREAKISRQVAEVLGYQWLFVEYPTNNSDYYQPEDLKKFQRYAGNLVSLPHIQDFFAVKKLKADRAIPDNAIFLPGHTGDMLTGSHIPRNLDRSQDCTNETFWEHILRTHYCLWDWRNVAQIDQIFKEIIEKAIAGVEVDDSESCANAIELFDFSERQAKFIVNSVRVYEFFGYSWGIPLWDNELIEFFKKIPLKYRVGSCLYKKYTVEKLFVNSLHDLSRIDCTTSLSENCHLLSSVNILNYCRETVSNFKSIFSYDIEGAFTQQNPAITNIISRFFGYQPESYHNFKLINDIFVYSQNSRFVPTVNGRGTIDYLKNIFPDNN